MPYLKQVFDMAMKQPAVSIWVRRAAGFMAFIAGLNVFVNTVRPLPGMPHASAACFWMEMLLAVAAMFVGLLAFNGQPAQATSPTQHEGDVPLTPHRDRRGAGNGMEG